MRRLILLLLFATASAGGAAVTNNNDSCDIGLAPAATLLLPYFEVDFETPGATTLFTVTNTAALPQAARVTLWTDYAYPVLSFNLFLTGYDVQSVDLRELFTSGRIAANEFAGSAVSPVGVLSAGDNPRLAERTCAALPAFLPPDLLERIRTAFTAGTVAECKTAGRAHAHAIGYATVDVVGTCTSSLPIDAAYFAEEIRFDNVLIGDYIQLDSPRRDGQAGAMVHIRAFDTEPVNLPRTFYGRYQPAANPKRDARQPLPTLFAARWIAGGPADARTHLKIWRETASTSTTACSAYATTSSQHFVDVVSFDEDENPEVPYAPAPGLPIYELPPALRAASRVSVTDFKMFPEHYSQPSAGWLYMNLDCGRRGVWFCQSNIPQPPRQSWVVVSMSAAGRFSIDMDAAAMGNGCTPQLGDSGAWRGDSGIGPPPNRTP